MGKLKQTLLVWIPILIFILFVIIFLICNEYLNIVISSLILGFVLGTIPLIIKIDRKYDFLLNYFITMTAALVGIFLAIYFTQKETDKSTLITITNVLQSAKNDIYSCQLSTQSTLEKITDTSYKNILIYTKYKPNTFIEILKMDIILERISHRTLEKLSIMSCEMSTIYDYLFDKNDSYKEFVDKAHLYDTTLNVSFKLIDHEIKFLQDSISFNCLDSLVICDSIAYSEARKLYDFCLP